jgi:maltoporin
MHLAPVAIAAIAALASTGASAFEFHGYTRDGVGSNSKDGTQVCFQLPGAGSKYRLGNECDNYGEIQFDHNVYDGKDGVKFDYHWMAALQSQQVENTNTYISLKQGNSDIALRQNWAEAKNLPFLAGGSAWIGQRYYQRNDVHINDFFFWDTSGTGGGIEGIKAGPVTISYALFRNSINQDAATTRHDLRFSDIGVGPLGSLTVGLQYNSADTKSTVDKEKGYAGTLMLTTSPLLGGYNKAALQYAKGTAATFGLNSPSANSSVDSKDAKLVRFTESIQVQITPELSGMAVLVVQKSETPGNDWVGFNSTWTSIGVRPVFAINDYLKIQGELGYDQIKPGKYSAIQDKMNLTKFTIAPTIAAGKGFFARPELRLFYTYAKWNDAARDNGVAGGTDGPFGTATSGGTYGIQLEAWW